MIASRIAFCSEEGDVERKVSDRLYVEFWNDISIASR